MPRHLLIAMTLLALPALANEVTTTETAVAAPAVTADLSTPAEPRAVLWIVTKSEFGYNNRFIEYANLAGCEKAWQVEREKAGADAQVWCTVAGETPTGAIRETR